MRLVMEHLYAMGHRSLAMIAGFSADNSDPRLPLFRSECERLGMRTARVITSDWRIDGGKTAMNELLAGPRDFSGVVAANDNMAVGALQACRERGVRVPEDLSLTGWDNVALSTVAYPPITTVHFPRHEAGIAAFELLVDLLEEGVPRSLELLPELIVRGSTGSGTGL